MRNWLNIVENALSTGVVKSFDVLWHVGSMDAANKRHGSYEGAGLSVSQHPQAWSRIARGHVNGDVWELTKRGNRFLDYHNITEQLRSQIEAWGVANGYIESTVEYFFSYYDDEWEMEMVQSFPTAERAEAEAEGFDADIDKRVALRGTKRLQSRTKGAPGHFDALVPVWVEDTTDLDGVWWADLLDESRLSAPRGVIVPTKVKTWNARKVSDQPYGEDLSSDDEGDFIQGPHTPHG